MKYLVEFREKATLTRLIQCEIEAENEKEVEKIIELEVVKQKDQNILLHTSDYWMEYIE